MPKDNIDHIDLVSKPIGNERRAEILEMPFEKSGYAPKAVTYEDMDEAFKEWAKSLSIKTDEGVEFETMTLFSNQRFSEYSQSWKFTDKNKNLLLNFKTVTRENNPNYGKIESGLWNIPGERFYLIRRLRVLDDNGTESYMDIRMRQPMSCDLVYKLSIFTNKYQSLNEFNTMVNRKFSSCQCYLAPNGYYMPMTLQSISDESEYSIDDRQFYSQTYNITLMGFIITEEDLRISQYPMKYDANFLTMVKKKKINDIDVADNYCGDNDDEYDYTTFTVTFPPCVNTSPEFSLDGNFLIKDIEYENAVRSCKVFLNDEEVDYKDLYVREGEMLKIKIKHKNIKKDAVIKINGIYPQMKK